MKKLAVLIFLIVIGTIILSFLSRSDFLGIRPYFYTSACDKPIPYRIGTIDPRFGLSRPEVVSATEKASYIWNTALGKQLFTYSSQATLSINMVYDRRQLLNTQINQLENDLTTGKTTLQAEIEKYENLSAEFDRRAKAFEEKVNYWNSQGGAPEEEYVKLTREQQDLTNESARLIAMAKELNLSTDQYNNQVGELNQTVKSFNNALQIKPEEGVYNPQEERIDIFFRNSRNELIRTIAHELGHARGLNHSVNQNAIMYPSTTELLTPSVDEITELSEICQKRPFYQPLFENALFRIGNIVQAL